MPWIIVGLQIVNRKSWWAEIGYDAGKYPQTWEEYREAGKKLNPSYSPRCRVATERPHLRH